jgi:hypothetical protein
VFGDTMLRYNVDPESHKALTLKACPEMVCIEGKIL